MALDPYPQQEILEDRSQLPTDPEVLPGPIDVCWAACAMALATMVALVVGT